MNDPHDQNDWADISEYEARKTRERRSHVNKRRNAWCFAIIFNMAMGAILGVLIALLFL